MKFPALLHPLAAALLALSMLGLAGAAAAQDAAPAAAGAPRTINWEDLVPKNWDPMALLNKGRNIGSIREGSGEEQSMMKELRRVWDEAPTRSELSGQVLRLPGYVVPLEQVGTEVKEFLLVPYFGACIHSPPPPANQIVHVVLAKPAAIRTMDAVWASGKVATRRTDSPMGTSGYAFEAAKVEPYEIKRPQK